MAGILFSFVAVIFFLFSTVSLLCVLFLTGICPALPPPSSSLSALPPSSSLPWTPLLPSWLLLASSPSLPTLFSLSSPHFLRNEEGMQAAQVPGLWGERPVDRLLPAVPSNPLAWA